VSGVPNLLVFVRITSSQNVSLLLTWFLCLQNKKKKARTAVATLPEKSFATISSESSDNSDDNENDDSDAEIEVSKVTKGKGRVACSAGFDPCKNHSPVQFPCDECGDSIHRNVPCATKVGNSWLCSECCNNDEAYQAALDKANSVKHAQKKATAAGKAAAPKAPAKKATVREAGTPGKTAASKATVYEAVAAPAAPASTPAPESTGEATSRCVEGDSTTTDNDDDALIAANVVPKAPKITGVNLSCPCHPLKNNEKIPTADPSSDFVEMFTSMYCVNHTYYSPGELIKNPNRPQACGYCNRKVVLQYSNGATKKDEIKVSASNQVYCCSYTKANSKSDGNCTFGICKDCHDKCQPVIPRGGRERKRARQS